MEENGGKFKLFLENTNVGIFSFNKNHEYKEINSKFCGLIGYDRLELINYKFPEPFWTSKFFQKAEKDFEIYKQTGLLSIETFFCRKNNTFFPVSLTGSVIPHSEHNNVEFIILIEDISEKKKNQRELKMSQDMLISLNNKLEQLVKKRTHQLQKVIQQKNDFIKQLDHDLKNPLTPLITLLPILLKKTSDNECREIIAAIERNAIYMRDLIINTIELAKLDSPNIPFIFEKINLKQEIDSIIQTNFPFSNEKNIKIFNEIPNDILIDVDKLRLNELITNLVGNSIKYGKDQGIVRIATMNECDHTIQMYIIDDGIGMNQEQLHQVFNEFYKVNQQHSTFKSSGLGMSICKRIIEKHGGTITCNSEGIGKGTTVTCKLPLKQVESIENDTVDLSIENNDAIKYEPT
jgi:PAS domain S-box-containing protein